MVESGSSADEVEESEAMAGRGSRWLARWLPTLKSRLAVGATLVLFAAVGLTAGQMSEVAQTHMLRAVEMHEQTEVQRTADTLGRRVRAMQRSLAVASALLTPEVLADPDRLRAFFATQTVLRAGYAVVSVSDDQGRVLMAATRDSFFEPRLRLGESAVFQRAMRTRRVTISHPVMGVSSREPVVAFMQPLVDAEDRAYGVLLGSLPLANGELAQEVIDPTDAASEGDELTVVADASGRIVSHPDRRLLLEPISKEPRLADAHARWLQAGRPLSAHPGAWSTGEDLVAMAGEPETGWQLWRVVPRGSLLVPLRAARNEALLLGGVFSLAMAVLMVLFLAYQLRPLERLQRRAGRLLAGDQRAAWPRAGGEIGRLADSLRQVVAERALAEQARTEVLRRLASVLAASPIGLAFQRDGRFELVSAEVCRLLGYDEAQLVGGSTGIIFASAQDHAALQAEVAAAFAHGEVYEGEWRLVGIGGQPFWSRLRARPVDAADPAAGAIWCLYDISSQVDARERLEHAVRHDPLTGLLNRDGFARAVHRVLAENADPRAVPRPATLVMLDLDRFKPVNDSAGHAAGDAMLELVADAILESVRSSDAAARIGGDEFALLLAHCDARQGLAVAHKVGQAIAALRLDWDGRTLQVGASLGVAELDAATMTAESWLAAADAACYEAKRRGGGAIAAGA